MIGGVISAMVMSQLVIRVLYVLFDSAAGGLLWLMQRLFAVRAEQLAWLIGEYREEKCAEPADTDSRRVPETVSV